MQSTKLSALYFILFHLPFCATVLYEIIVKSLGFFQPTVFNILEYLIIWFGDKKLYPELVRFLASGKA